MTKGPRLWARFAEKYGDPSKVKNFFFGDHSVARDRQRNLQQELEFNYRNASLPPPAPVKTKPKARATATLNQ